MAIRLSGLIVVVLILSIRYVAFSKPRAFNRRSATITAMLKNPPSPFFEKLIARGYIEDDAACDASGKSGYRLTGKAITEMENLHLARDLDQLLREGTRADNPDTALLEMPLRFIFGPCA